MCSPIKLSSIKSFSSESHKYPAENLLTNVDVSESSSWKCKQWIDYCWVILELEQESLIDSITIYNQSSAFIEIFSLNNNFDFNSFRVLLPVFAAQAPNHSREKTNCNKKFTFSSKYFTSAKNYPCKFIKCVCSQPYNKKIRFGLSRIEVYGNKYEKQKENLGRKFKLIDRNIVSDKFFDKYDFEQKKQVLKTFEIKEKKTESKNEDQTVSPTVKTEFTTPKSPKILKQTKNKIQEGLPSENGPSTSTKNSSTSIRKRNEKTSDDKKIIEEKKKKINNNKSSAPPLSLENLMSDVVFVISGYENPERGILRDKALTMGAKYEHKWNRHCTHLICAFANTPKYKEVNQLGGRIVSGQWIEDTYSQRKCLPWRNYMLDGNKISRSSTSNNNGRQTEDNNNNNSSTRTRNDSTSRQHGQQKQYFNEEKNNYEKNNNDNVNADEDDAMMMVKKDNGQQQSTSSKQNNATFSNSINKLKQDDDVDDGGRKQKKKMGMKNNVEDNSAYDSDIIYDLETEDDDGDEMN